MAMGGLVIPFAPPTSATQGTVSINIQNFAFNPATITLVVGINNTVTWTNLDSTTHTVTSTSVPSGAQSFSSGNLNAGGTFTNAFTVPGTYSYHCSIHTYMIGTIIVKGSSVSTSSTTTSANGGGIPEFPFQGVLVAAVTLAVLASYLLVREIRGSTLPSAHSLPPGSPNSDKILK